jgi:hypothetical protein
MEGSLKTVASEFAKYNLDLVAINKSDGRMMEMS